MAAIAVLLLTLILEAFLPGAWQAVLDKWIPFNAGSQIWSTVRVPSAHQFSPWAGFAVFTAYAAIALGAGLCSSCGAIPEHDGRYIHPPGGSARSPSLVDF